MPTQTRGYKIAGKEVGPLAGTVVQFPVFQTMQDGIARCGSEADALELLQSAYDVWLQGRVRTVAGKQDKDKNYTATPETVQAFIDGAKYTRRAEGTGEKKEPGVVKQMKNERAEQIARLRELRASDPKEYAKAKRAGYVPASILAEVEAEAPAQAQA